MILAIIRLGLSFYGPYLLIHDVFSPLNLGLIGGTVNLLFWIVLLWLGFNIFAKKELKKHKKLLVALVVLLTIVFSTKAILDHTRDNFINNAKSKTVQGVTQDSFDDTQPNKVYLKSDYEGDTIEPKIYDAKGTVYSIFIYNETAHSIKANQKITLKPFEGYLFKIPDTTGIALDNGIQFFFGETEGLEVVDTKVQVAGLGEEWWGDLNVPKFADWAFLILEVGKGDPIPE
ncbi:MAG: hypothetical protein AAF554_14400 [Bacteroidota bacterium]